MASKLDTSDCVLPVSDFDGFLTYADREGAPFWDSAMKHLSILTGMTVERVRERSEELVDRMDPARDAWLFRGVASAPATADPYLRIQYVGRRILGDEYETLNDPLLSKLLYLLYYVNYPMSGVHFRPGAADFLTRLYHAPGFVVTNAETNNVQRKLRWLARNEGWDTSNPFPSMLIGDAKKLLIDDIDCIDFEDDGHGVHWDDVGVPRYLKVPGLKRHVFPRRPTYFMLLDRLREERGLEWGQILVFGDIMEFDLLLPMTLGCKVVLLRNEDTSVHDIAFIEDSANGIVIDNLKDAIALLPG